MKTEMNRQKNRLSIASNQLINKGCFRLMTAGIIVCNITNQSMSSSELNTQSNENKDMPNSSALKATPSPEKLIQLFKKSMAEIIENMHADETVFAKYISPKYTQWVDGKTIDYQGFVRHMAAQKRKVKSVKVNFVKLIAMDNVLSTIHDVKFIKKDGTRGCVRVIGHMTYEGEKVIDVKELTFVMKGDAQDKELGSIE